MKAWILLIAMMIVLAGCSIEVPTSNELPKQSKITLREVPRHDAPDQIKTACNDYCWYIPGAYDYDLSSDYKCTCVDENYTVLIDKQLTYTNFDSASKVSIPSSLISQLNSKFASDPWEFEYCIYGKSNGDTIEIDSIDEAIYEFRNATKVNITGCPDNGRDKIGYIHSHPNQNCRFSGDDIYNLNNEKLLEGISCGNNRLSFYTTNDDDTSLQILKDGVEDMTLDAPYCPPGAGDWEICNGECSTGCTAQGKFECREDGPWCVCDDGVDDCAIPLPSIN